MNLERFPYASEQEQAVAERGSPTPEVLRERSERLRERSGVSFSAKTKEGEIIPLREQLRLAAELNPGSVQFDYRGRTLQEVAEAAGDLATYRAEHPDQTFSLHGDTPRIDANTRAISNTERIMFESKLSEALGAESYTVHPPSVRAEQWRQAPAEIRGAVLESFLSAFDDAARAAAEDGRVLSIAIENLPNKGAEGSFGQSIEELRTIIEEGGRRLQQRGIQVHGRVFGITFDVNHALEGVPPEDAERVISSWFSELSDAIRVVHLYAPSGGSETLRTNYDLVLRLAAQHSPDAQLLVESKQDPEATRRAYDAIREAGAE